MRVPQKEGERGSLKWMQRLAVNMPHSVGSRLNSLVGLKQTDHIEWLSPAPGDRAEFRDAAFLEQIGRPDLASRLADFWPRGGPQWDGLAKCGDKVILVEAKAHAAELRSSSKASEPSLAKIKEALSVAQKRFRARESKDWSIGFYQYANRLAHLDFLTKQGVDAHLVFIYFYNADMNGPKTEADWAPAIAEVHTGLGLTNLEATGRVHDLFVNAEELR